MYEWFFMRDYYSSGILKQMKLEFVCIYILLTMNVHSEDIVLTFLRMAQIN